MEKYLQFEKISVTFLTYNLLSFNVPGQAVLGQCKICLYFQFKMSVLLEFLYKEIMKPEIESLRDKSFIFGIILALDNDILRHLQQYAVISQL